MSLSKDFCNDISVIPQFNDTCWFNAILMTCFFSQRMRNLMINKVSKTWDNSSLFKFFKTILKNSYNKDDKDRLKELLTLIKPEIILLKVLSKSDEELLKVFKIDYDFKWYIDYITNFLNFINVNFLDITVLKNNKILFNFLNYRKPRIIDDKSQLVFAIDYKIDIEKEKNKITKIIDKVPDVLVLNHYLFSENNFTSLYNKIIEINNNYKFLEATNFNINVSEIDDIVNYKDEINLFGNIYKLEAVLLDNYNTDADGHTILGIHCNNNRYVYNGWLKNNRNYDTPCPLFKFDWNLKTNYEFCLNTKDCKLDKIDLKEPCFSFNKGNQILIYVKEDRKKTSTILDSSNFSLSHKDDILKDFYGLNKLNIDNIKTILDHFEIYYDTDNDDFDELEDLLLNKLQDDYNYNEFSKLQLIDAIKGIKPDLRGLNNKTKRELKELLNKIEIEEVKLGMKRKN
jgi:hypothetical protein